MLSISPVRENEICKALREFIRDDFQSRRLGSRALFTYSGHRTLPLIRVSASEVLDFVQTPELKWDDKVWPDPARIVSWRFSSSGSQSLSVLHALLPDDNAREIRGGHTLAMLTVLREFVGCMFGAEEARGWTGNILDERASRTGNPADRYVRERNSTDTPQQIEQGHFLIFSSAASHDQNPNLQTTAFFQNVRSTGTGLRTLVSPEDIDRIRSPLSESYAGALDFFASKAIGLFQRDEHAAEQRILGVPQALVKSFFYDSALNDGPQNGNAGKRLSEPEMIANWRAKAEHFGWGPKQARALLDGLKREQYWADVRARCVFKAKQVPKLLHRVKGSLTRVLKGDGRPVEPKAKTSKDRDNTQSH